ncbi:OmpH family outer membrane protein [Deefgea sp. CFH1-16]|uniref:OmpH family outer membrane protein n=1 Tax=Deefgea sp. CFH1-16 TaxID=2675457 RepID=UPI0035B22275
MKLIKLWPIFFIFAVANVFADTKIGFVDTQRILREASPAVRAAKKLEKEFEPRRAEMQRVSTQGKLLQQVLDKKQYIGK